MAGEFYKFTDDERMKTIDAVVDETDGKVPVLAGIHHSGTEPAVKLGRYANNVLYVICTSGARNREKMG